MEAEARFIIEAELMPKLNLAESIRSHIAPLGGVKLAVQPREQIREHPAFAEWI
jgi:hypothetical protein